MPSLVILLEYLEKVNTASGLLLTSILLYAIRWFSGPNLGSYKNLLTTFAATDLFLIVLHAVVRPRTVLVGTTHGVSTDTILDDRRVTAIYIAFQSVPFTLLIIHFLYRYWSVRRRNLLYLFSTKAFILVLAMVIVGELNAWFMMSMYVTTDPTESIGRYILIHECERKYGRHIEHAWIVLDHWQNDRLDNKLFVTVILTNVLMFSSIILASTLAFLTFHHLKYLDASSIQFNILQRKLLFALCVQAAVPLLFVHIPSLIAIDLPFLRLSGGPIHDFVSPIYTCFPLWDAAAIILLISDYRRGLLHLMHVLEHLVALCPVSVEAKPHGEHVSRAHLPGLVTAMFGPLAYVLPREASIVVFQIALVSTSMMWSLIPVTAMLQLIGFSRISWPFWRRITVSFIFTALCVIDVAWLSPGFAPTSDFALFLEDIVCDLYGLENGTKVAAAGSTATHTELNNGRSLITIMLYMIVATYTLSYGFFVILVLLIRRRLIAYGVTLSERTLRLQRAFQKMQLLQGFLPLAIISIPASVFVIGTIAQTNMDFVTLLLTFFLWICPSVQAGVQLRFVRQAASRTPESTKTGATSTRRRESFLGSPSRRGSDR